MILTTHALIGAALGKNIPNPWIIVTIVIPLHFLMDHFRHGEYIESPHKKTSIKNIWWKALIDFSIGMLFLFCFINYKNFDYTAIRNIILGTFFSLFPDMLTVLYWILRWPFLKKIHDFHVWCHKYPPFSSERQWNLRNALNDITFSVLALLLLLF